MPTYRDNIQGSGVHAHTELRHPELEANTALAPRMCSSSFDGITNLGSKSVVQ